MAFLWAALLTAYVDFLSRYLHWAIVGGLLGVLFLSDIMRIWILGMGVFWSEGLYTVTILAALYAAARSASAGSERASFGWAGGVGLMLGVSAYVRSQSDALGWIMMAVLVGWGALTLIRITWRKRKAASGQAPTSGVPTRTWQRKLLLLLTCAIAFQLVTIPWRIYAENELRPGSYAWSQSRQLWAETWIPDRVFVDRNLEWVLAGSPGTACKVDPGTCEEIAAYELRQPQPYWGESRYDGAEYRRLAFRAFATSPIEFSLHRVNGLRKVWFWEPTYGSGNEFVQNGFFALAVIAALGLSARRLWRSGPDLVSLMYPGLFLASMLPHVLVHYEARYLFTVKLVAVVAVFVLFALDQRDRSDSIAEGSIAHGATAAGHDE
jgi:hypothetical protein